MKHTALNSPVFSSQTAMIVSNIEMIADAFEQTRDAQGWFAVEDFAIALAIRRLLTLGTSRLIQCLCSIAEQTECPVVLARLNSHR